MATWRYALSNAEPARAALERAYHADHGRVVGALMRRFGSAHLDRIEGALQEAMVRALEQWSSVGAPERADAWLLRVAHNLLVDELRRDARLVAFEREHETRVDPLAPEVDDELELMFLCAHPSLSRAQQIALTLRTACGFTTSQIARAFLTEEKTLAQRIVRAKQRLREVGVPFEMPGEADLAARLDPVLDVLYLVFSEGYNPTDGEAAIKNDLCAEALRRIRLITDREATATPASEALRAFLCFQASRVDARMADDGSLLLLHEQDRARWNADLIAEGFTLLGRAARGDELTRFHLEAGIAACHAAARTHADTNWPRVLTLYDALRERVRSPIVEVNRAVAVAMVSGAVAGLDELDAIPERDIVERYPFALAAYAELHASLGRIDEARAYLVRALSHQPARVQQAVLLRKHAALAHRP